jgi:hypothetical protein
VSIERRIRDLERFFEADAFEDPPSAAVGPPQLTVISLPDNGRGPGGPIKQPIVYQDGDHELRIYPADEFPVIGE